MKDELRKILEELCEDYHSEIEHGNQEQKKLLPYAVDAILELFNKRLPKEKHTMEGSPPMLEHNGYNQCLADIKLRIEEIE